MHIRDILTYVRRSRKDFRRFVAQSRKQRSHPTGGPGLLQSLRYFPAWRRRLRGTSALDDGLPWITFPAIRFLERTLTAGMRVFEYGSGGSTLFFAERVESVVSIEHDPDWHARVVDRLRERGCTNASVELVEPVATTVALDTDPADLEGYVSGGAQFRRYSFERYVRRIDEYPDGHFDVILVDGRARPSCTKHALTKLRAAGHLILDNSERDYYGRALELADRSFKRTDFPGPTPYATFFVRTSAWRRPD